MNNGQNVVITGIGLITPLGADVATNWKNLIAGCSGITNFDDSNQDGSKRAVVGFARHEQALLDQVLDKKNQIRTDRFIHLGLIAAREALSSAGLLDQSGDGVNKKKGGVYVGVGIGGLQSIGENFNALHEGGPRKVSPFAVPKSINNLAASWISMQWGLQGPVAGITNACSSGADAIGMAARLIKSGYADYMVAGGTESCVIPLALAAFNNMRALTMWQGNPQAASRPFDKDRTGFVLAEGAGMMILEREDHARSRGAAIYGLISGYGAASDAYHMTAMHPEGVGAINAMQAAMDDAGVKPEHIDYINAHGTGTLMNDVIESRAIEAVFGDYARPDRQDHLLISSTKSMTGHMIGAAGAVEAIYTTLMLKHQIIAPTINLDNPDEACVLDYVPHQARKAQVRHALSNSFGFGGANAVLALSRYV